MLVLVVVPLGCFMVECREEGDVEAVWGAGVMGTWSLGFMLDRSTFNDEGLWPSLLRVSMFQTDGSGSENCLGSKPPFKPLGYTN